MLLAFYREEGQSLGSRQSTVTGDFGCVHIQTGTRPQGVTLGSSQSSVSVGRGVASLGAVAPVGQKDPAAHVKI